MLLVYKPTRCEEVVAVEVQHQDDSKGWLPGQAQAAHDVDNAGAEPGDEAKLFGSCGGWWMVGHELVGVCLFNQMSDGEENGAEMMCQSKASTREGLTDRHTQPQNP